MKKIALKQLFVIVTTSATITFAYADTDICKLSNTPFGKLIRKQESAGSYNAWNAFKRNSRGDKYLVSYISGGGKDLQNMTIAKIVEEQKQGTMFATGAYQIVNKANAPVLNEAIKYLGLNPLDTYSKTIQDKIFDEYLTKGKRKQIYNYFYGNGDIESGALATAREWASMPVKKGTTLAKGSIAKSNCNVSYYDGNKFDSSNICYETLINAMEVSKQQLQSNACNPEEDIDKDEEAKEKDKEDPGVIEDGEYTEISIGGNPGDDCGGCRDWGLGAKLGNRSMSKFKELDAETARKISEIIDKINEAHQGLEVQSKDILIENQRLLQLEAELKLKIANNERIIVKLQNIINTKDSER